MALLAAAAAAAGLHAWRVHAAAAQVERGRRLAEGSAALPGRIAGHDVALPAATTRCANCHQPAASATVPASLRGGIEGVASAAPPLDRRSLTTAQPRRNGPPSAYDAAALCRLLRTGVDPASIVLPATMPRFSPTDAQCAELWAFLVAR